jgi:hypothetical protein
MFGMADTAVVNLSREPQFVISMKCLIKFLVDHVGAAL